MELNESFWNGRYQDENTGWDLGVVSTPLKAYFDQLSNKDLRILIPGGGNSYEAEYLHQLGFTNVYVVDLSETALNNIKKRVPGFPKEHLLHDNFFNLTNKFDLIIEQTFFCALDPKLRTSYAEQMAKLLANEGKLVGLLFDTELNTGQPPFGGDREEYINYFKSYFDVEIMEDCYNSEVSRRGRELFVKMNILSLIQITSFNKKSF